MNFKLRIWRQKNPKTKGKLVKYEARDISPHTSFLEMLDIVNEQLISRNQEPIAFDSDCREGICGTCALTINGEAHGPDHPGRRASFTCAVSKMARPSRWNHFARNHSL